MITSTFPLFKSCFFAKKKQTNYRTKKGSLKLLWKRRANWRRFHWQNITIFVWLAKYKIILSEKTRGLLRLKWIWLVQFFFFARIAWEFVDSFYIFFAYSKDSFGSFGMRHEKKRKKSSNEQIITTISHIVDSYLCWAECNLFPHPLDQQSTEHRRNSKQ